MLSWKEKAQHWQVMNILITAFEMQWADYAESKCAGLVRSVTTS
ncbi:hypothetical protein M2118_000322 [Aurantimicrobium minutum]|nr:hypothetical protein [Aurantimicrobium minutum]